MSKLRVACLSIAVALLLIVIARTLPVENPISIVQFPGWAMGFRAGFAANDNLFTTIFSECIYWVVNIGLWSFLFFGIFFMVDRLRRHSINK